MNKKVVIGIIAGVVVAIIGVVVFLILSQSKVKPEDIWQSYIKLINEQKYEEMYAMLTQESKSQISKEDFIARNKNIYEGIEMSDMKSEITAIEEENSSVRKISYNLEMNTDAGNVNFTNSVRLTKDKEKGYLINWSSSLIFPQLNNTDMVIIMVKHNEIAENEHKLRGKLVLDTVHICREIETYSL